MAKKSQAKKQRQPNRTADAQIFVRIKQDKKDALYEFIPKQMLTHLTICLYDAFMASARKHGPAMVASTLIGNVELVIKESG